jgi:glutathione S-transferase
MLVLHGHPLSTYCMKAAMALYEGETPFRHAMVDLGDEAARARFYALSGLGKMPVLEDEDRGEVVPETSAIIEYLATYYPGGQPLAPADPDLAWRARLAERVFDLYVQTPMQKIVADRLRPEGAKDPTGVEEARRQIATGLDYVEQQMAGRTWALGEVFSGADCAAAPALYYANKVAPFEASHPATWAYFERLKARPSFARCLEEAGPYLHMYPEA